MMGLMLYSPDMARNDYFLFPHMKNKLRGQHFLIIEEAVHAFKTYAFGVTSIGVEKVLRKLIQTHASALNFTEKKI